MIRIIDRVAYERRSGTGFRLKAFETESGHLELSAVRLHEWHELELTEKQLVALESAKWNAENDPLRQKERHELSLKVAANRAKTRVRRCCKSIGADTLLTLTYRANELDLQRVKRDLKSFNRRMENVLPDFRFVAAFERQERGAWHVHIATAGIPKAFKRTGSNGQPYTVKSFDVIRAIWRAVTGERGGNIDVARRKRNSQSSPAKIASYLSKYMAKDFENVQSGVNRYAVYGDFSLPAVIDLGIVSDALQAVEVCYSLTGSHTVVMQHYSRWGDWFFLHAEKLVIDPVVRRVTV